MSRAFANFWLLDSELSGDCDCADGLGGGVAAGEVRRAASWGLRRQGGEDKVG